MNNLFWFYMNCIGSILKFIIVVGITGFIFLLPLLLKGGWIIYLMIGFYVISSIIVYYISKDKGGKNE